MSSEKIQSYFIIFRRIDSFNEWVDDGSEEFENKSFDELISDSIKRLGIDGYYGGTITGLRETYNIPLDILKNIMRESMKRGEFINLENIRAFRFQELNHDLGRLSGTHNEKIILFIGENK